MNPIKWIEFPVSDMNRAVAFYNAVFGYDLKIIDLGALLMAQFPGDNASAGASGALVYNPAFYNSDSEKGPLVYLDCENVTDKLNLIEAHGGKTIIKEKQISPEYGSMGVALDSEGNRIALHANPKN